MVTDGGLKLFTYWCSELGLLGMARMLFFDSGDCDRLASWAGLDFHDFQLFLDYAATFLSNIGDYYGSDDQKFVPLIGKEKLGKLAACASPRVVALWEQICVPMFQEPPLSLGPPGGLMQSSYYQGYENCASSFRDMRHWLSGLCKIYRFLPENTRLRRARLPAEREVLSIIQASVAETRTLCNGKISDTVQSDQVIEHEMIGKLRDSSITGDLAVYKESQSIWVTNKAPKVEAALGFVESYKDPLGVRSLAYCSSIIFPGINLPNCCMKYLVMGLANSSQRYPRATSILIPTTLRQFTSLGIQLRTRADLDRTTDGLRGLENYDPVTKKWSQAHSQAHYVIFRHLLRDSPNLYAVNVITLTHIADIASCRDFYESLSNADFEALTWTDIVVAKKDPLSQANTFTRGDAVELREYEPTAGGVIQSWAAREIQGDPVLRAQRIASSSILICSSIAYSHSIRLYWRVHSKVFK
ncbi:hypothetical protein AN5466.2 [Aspergillus nidulans FGSC A4]|uniref:Uncharacterized protein n=1 Tax=Emericella nidulans (strain FGSC A4 / ATCC 38163 / CBS 112.46 / NRRL 194 / M139) TaxID=227321 RepID=Q5B1W4_EMENI|nr:hypothetical protein [Aspergillus nidulans FGSC A4]EAA62626.1 hypothetical protein AN5466.2 [Aspergillus nidulans FGSC A4]CBF81859.1 TPA: conserved hypothetical protein [Aspergillus nidulans FGSC A4]|eukprot:XP_663070.1 hypothetical protein AN5466.2 [Aspergillus nidulans FGSC A4]